MQLDRHNVEVAADSRRCCVPCDRRQLAGSEDEHVAMSQSRRHLQLARRMVHMAVVVVEVAVERRYRCRASDVMLRATRRHVSDLTLTFAAAF